MMATSTGMTVVADRNLAACAALDERQYLTFSLAGEQYGIDILKVQEIRGWTPVTHIPNVPDFVKGVMDLRGAIVPIVDLRGRFNLEAVTYSNLTVVILAMVGEGAGSRVVGLVVDGVSDVLDIQPGEIQPPPDFGSTVNTEFLKGLVTRETGMVLLLDMERLLAVDELYGLAGATANRLAA
ncbi:MAG: chemotaxis protein CheW [Candidatus Competibacter phosphatis]